MKDNLRKMQILVAAFIIAWPMLANALQSDGPYLAAEKRFGQQWRKQDEAVDSKLAALREKFGKRPNIVYILTDDIGWG